MEKREKNWKVVEIKESKRICKIKIFVNRILQGAKESEGMEEKYVKRKQGYGGKKKVLQGYISIFVESWYVFMHVSLKLLGTWCRKKLLLYYFLIKCTCFKLQMTTLIRPAKQCTSMLSGTTPLFSSSLMYSSWLFSPLILNIPSAYTCNLESKVKQINTYFIREYQDSNN